MKTFLVTCFLLTDIYFVLADHKTNSKASLYDKEPEAQRRSDSAYYYNTLNRFISGNHHGFGRNGYRGRIVTRLQNQVSRPFKHYGPPNQEDSSYNHDHNQPTSTDNVSNLEAPSPIRDNDFAEESPIASQNNQPFGQHTANYLPPRNQKLPSNSPAHLFSNQNHDFPEYHQQHFQQQPQLDNQNFLGQDQNAPNSNFGQNEFTNQQISDAALFLSQNAQAISDLYGAPAPNENYAPNIQESEHVDHNQQQSQQNFNFQIKDNGQSKIFPSQLPSYASGVLSSQVTLEKIQSLEKDRIIAQLQQALTNRETAARYTQDINSNNSPHSENLITGTSQFSTINKLSKFNNVSPSYVQRGSPFLSSTRVNSLGYQGYYGQSTPVTTTTQAPVSATSPSTTTTTLQPRPGNSGAGSTHIGTGVPATRNFNPTVVNPGFSQYGGFVPTFIAAPSLIPNVPTYGNTFVPTTALRSAESSPTHFRIPIPTLPEQKPARSSPTIIPTSVKPASHPSTPALTIPLGPIHTAQPVQPAQPPHSILPPTQTTVLRPNPIPVIPEATPVHPTYGLHPSVINPGFVYKPVKVFPVYYYPSISYQSVHKTLGTTTSSHPWSYAPSFSQVKPTQIWK